MALFIIEDGQVEHSTVSTWDSKSFGLPENRQNNRIFKDVLREIGLVNISLWFLFIVIPPVLYSSLFAANCTSYIGLHLKMPSFSPMGSNDLWVQTMCGIVHASVEVTSGENQPFFGRQREKNHKRKEGFWEERK